MTPVGIIPAAGYATRVQPLPCSKEVYPFRGRPVMEHLLERMRLGGASEIRVVTRPDKEDVIAVAEAQGARVVLGNPPTMAASLALGIDGLAPDEVVLIGFPDSVWEPRDAYRTLVERLGEGCRVAMGLFPVPDPETCDVVIWDGEGRVTDIEVKRPDPSSNLIWGCAAARRCALDGVGDVPDPGHLMRMLAAEGRVSAVRMSDDFVDVGKSRDVLLGPEAG